MFLIIFLNKTLRGLSVHCLELLIMFGWVLGSPNLISRLKSVAIVVLKNLRILS